MAFVEFNDSGGGGSSRPIVMLDYYAALDVPAYLDSKKSGAMPEWSDLHPFILRQYTRTFDPQRHALPEGCAQIIATFYNDHHENIGAAIFGFGRKINGTGRGSRENHLFVEQFEAAP